MTEDAFSAFKQRQRDMWSSFAPAATFTTPVAAHLVRFAGVTDGESVLDVGTGTGVVAITAAGAGARVRALDLTPALLERAAENGRLADCGDIDWTEGDAEFLPYPDGTFDVVLSQFGHMFAPRPERVVAEVRRVLKPSGRVAFATWPPQFLVGSMMGWIGRNSPPPPPGTAPPPLWGDREVVAQRLAGSFQKPTFETGVMTTPALSVAHYRLFMERSVGPLQKLMESAADSPQRLEALRGEFEEMTAPYYADNVVRQEYLLTKAVAR